MTVITPIRRYIAWLDGLFFWAAPMIPAKLFGLVALSLIHDARRVIVGPRPGRRFHARPAARVDAGRPSNRSVQVA